MRFARTAGPAGWPALFLALALVLAPMPGHPALAEDLPPAEDLWYGVYVRGQKIGAAHSVWENPAEGPRYALTMDLAFTSLGQEVHVTSEERYRFAPRPPHALVSLASTDSSGRRVSVDQAPDGYHLHAVIGGQETDKDLPEAARLTLAAMDAPRGFFAKRPATDASLTVPAFFADQLVVGNQTYTVTGERHVTFGGVNMTVFEATVSSEMVPWQGQLVVDGDGRILSTVFGGSLELRLESEEVAKKRDLAVDLFTLGQAPVDAPLGRPRDLARLVLEASGPEVGRLEDGPGQSISPGGRPGTVRLTLAPDQGGLSRLAGPAEAAENAKATPHYPAGDPKVLALARRAADGETDPGRLAGRLATFVSAYVRDMLLPEPHSAIEIIDSPEGDCTEHALLYVTLARALGLPAREVFGLAYMGDEALAFGGHAWAEVIVDGMWRPVDPTFGEACADPGRVRTGAGLAGPLSHLAVSKDLKLSLVELIPKGQE